MSSILPPHKMSPQHLVFWLRCALVLGVLVGLGLGSACENDPCRATAGRLCEVNADCCDRLRCLFDPTTQTKRCVDPQNPNPNPNDGGDTDTDTSTDRKPIDDVPPGRCEPGQTAECYPLSTGCKKKSLSPLAYTCEGECSAGLRVCTTSKTWGSCEKAVGPELEVCDGKDNDCDGKVDDFTRKCYTGDATFRGKGACVEGQQRCRGGSWEACAGDVKPTDEICDGKDNDCDGMTDEMLTRACYTAMSGCTKKSGGSYECDGICQAGSQSCKGGKWEACAGETGPAAKEDCGHSGNGNQKDDNCNGQVDENCTCETPGKKQPCYDGPVGTEGKGLCQAGEQTCGMNYKWGACMGSVKPAVELCDNKDNNCDGQIDEAISQPCYSGSTGCTKKPDGTYDCVGTCATGASACNAGIWGACVGDVKPANKETCGDRLDNNCDGVVDEGCGWVIPIEAVQGSQLFVKMDPAGNTFAVGYVNGAGRRIGSKQSTTATYFAAKFDARGNTLWVTEIKGLELTLQDMALLPGGGIVTVGGARELTVGGKLVAFSSGKATVLPVALFLDKNGVLASHYLIEASTTISPGIRFEAVGSASNGQVFLAAASMDRLSVAAKLTLDRAGQKQVEIKRTPLRTLVLVLALNTSRQPIWYRYGWDTSRLRHLYLWSPSVGEPYVYVQSFRSTFFFEGESPQTSYNTATLWRFNSTGKTSWVKKMIGGWASSRSKGVFSPSEELYIGAVGDNIGSQLAPALQPVLIKIPKDGKQETITTLRAFAVYSWTPMALAWDPKGTMWGAMTNVHFARSNGLTVGGMKYVPKGMGDAFVVQFNAQIQPVLAITGGGSGVDTAEDIHIDSNGRIYVVGEYSGTDAKFSGYGLPPAKSGTFRYLWKLPK